MQRLPGYAWSDPALYFCLKAALQELLLGFPPSLALHSC